MTFYQSGSVTDERWLAAAPTCSATGAEDPVLQALRWRTVYDSVNAATPRNRLKRAVRRNGDLLSNSGSLMATSVLTSVVGFGYWWVAARFFPAEAVGSVSAALSAMTLVGTLGMFGMGTLLLAELPRMPGRQASLISTCVLVAGTVAGLGGIGYEVVAYFLNPRLREALGSPLAAIVLLVGMSLNAATLVLDEGLVGLLRGRLQLVRNAYFAVGKLALLAVLAVLPVTVTGTGVLATWVGGIVLSVALLLWSQRDKGLPSSLRPDLSLLRGLRRNALDHNLLNLALFLPRTMLPLVVTAVLSTRATAAFYTAWMVLSFLASVARRRAAGLDAGRAAGPPDHGDVRAGVRGSGGHRPVDPRADVRGDGDPAALRRAVPAAGPVTAGHRVRRPGRGRGAGRGVVRRLARRADRPCDLARGCDPAGGGGDGAAGPAGRAVPAAGGTVPRRPARGGPAPRPSHPAPPVERFADGTDHPAAALTRPTGSRQSSSTAVAIRPGSNVEPWKLTLT